MNVPSLDIKSMLDDDPNVDTSKFRIDRAILDESLSNCASILDVPGSKPQLTMDLAKYESPSVQIRVKCSDYDEGWVFLSSVVDSLHGRANFEWGGSYYSLITCLNGPGFLERENQRTIFVANFNIQRRTL